jgi:hypothetical protein
MEITELQVTILRGLAIRDMTDRELRVLCRADTPLDIQNVSDVRNGLLWGGRIDQHAAGPGLDAGRVEYALTDYGAETLRKWERAQTTPANANDALVDIATSLRCIHKDLQALAAAMRDVADGGVRVVTD